MFASRMAWPVAIAFVATAVVAGVPAHAVTTPSFDSASSYEIVDVNGDEALTAAGTDTTSDPAMSLAPPTGAEDQLWHIVDLGAGWYRIVNDHAGSSLSTVNGASGNGSVVHLWDYLGTYPDQHWSFADQGNGTVTIASQGTGNRLLSTQDGAMTTGTRMQLWDPVAGRAGQTWRLIPVTGTVDVDAGSITASIPATTAGTGMEDVNHEIYGGLYSQMIFGEAFQEPPDYQGVSDMWTATATGSATGTFAPATSAPFKGDRSQTITFTGGQGSVGIANSGLHHEGLNVVAHKGYDGMVTLRGTRGQRVRLALQNSAGSSTYATTTVTLTATGWQNYDFGLTPNSADTHARFVIGLTRPGSIDAGYAFLEPGSWGRYQNLPVRKDVVDALKAEGVQALRFGGSAINAESYRWKTMIGPRQNRPVTDGTWYPYESTGWGIFDFLNLGEAMGVQAIPSINVNETPQDISDLMDYLFAPATDRWGAQRAADGHPKPYAIDRIELGNEEAVDDTYWQKFQALAPVIWQKDPAMRIVVGDFAYHDVITDPFDFTGAPRITSLAAHQKILALAKSYGAEVDFDVHIDTEVTSDVLAQVKALDSYIYWLGRLGAGARFKVVVFELNANIHSQQRALANAYAIDQLSRLGDTVDVVSSANAFQVDGQNDNGWDQGLIFFDQSAVWAQPPYYVEQMNASTYQPDAVATTVAGGESHTADVLAETSADHRTLVLRVVNTLDVPRRYTISYTGFRPTGGTAAVTTLAAPQSATNTFADPGFVTPTTSTAAVGATQLTYTVAPDSYTTLTVH